MKKITKSIKIIALLAVCLIVPSVANAQAVKGTYFNVDWQLNDPLNSFASDISGWGAHAEGGYFVTPSVALGAFVSFHSNNEYIGRETLTLSPTAALNADQQHSIFQLPFGASLRYVLPANGMFEPYLGAKIGANYSEVSTFTDIAEVYDAQWGFFMSPEVGLSIYPSPESKFGFHVAAYFSYSTNKSEVLSYKVDGLSNWGLRLGIAF